MRFYISKGAAVDEPGGELRATPLHWATRLVFDLVTLLTKSKNLKSSFPFRQGHLMPVIILMKHGANPAFLDAEGFACIHIAAQFGHTAVIAYFVAKGVDINAQDINGFTPLMHCCIKHLRLIFLNPPVTISLSDRPGHFFQLGF